MLLIMFSFWLRRVDVKKDLLVDVLPNYYVYDSRRSINLEEQAGIILSLDEKIAELQELRKEKANEVKALMQEAELTELKECKHTFKLSKILRNSVDTKKLKTDFSEIYKALLKSSSYFKFEVV